MSKPLKNPDSGNADGVIVFDERGEIALFNQGAESIFGYSGSGVVGGNVRNLLALSLRKLPAQACGECIKVRGWNKRGETIPVTVWLSRALLGGHGVYTAVVRVCGRRNDAKGVGQFDGDFARRLIETAQVIVNVLDVEGGIILFNRYMEELSGYRLRELRGRDWFVTFLRPHEQARSKALFQRCLQGEAVDAFTNTIVTKSGHDCEIDWRASVLKDGDGKVVGVLSVGKDITQRIRAERELYQLNKVTQQRERLADVGAIAAQIVHDVGNPLAALSMQAQLIRKRAREYPDHPLGSVLKSAEQIVVELRRLESLVREFMNFAREQRLDLCPIDVAHFLADVVELWHPVAFARGILLTLEGSASHLVLRADEEKLRRVFDNLVKNAVEAIGEGPGRISIGSTVRTPDKLRISVADTGPGIAKSVEVFRLFESTKSNGSGLGLAVARQIVLAHGGTISFDRVSPRGTVFHVELPLGGPAANRGDR